MRNFALWLHILGAATWFGANVAQAVIGTKLMRDNAAAPGWLRAVEKSSGPIYGTAAVVIWTEIEDLAKTVDDTQLTAIIREELPTALAAAGAPDARTSRVGVEAGAAAGRGDTTCH